MDCPECQSKMIFDRDIKDYYCENCESSLEEIKLMKRYEHTSQYHEMKTKEKAKKSLKSKTTKKAKRSKRLEEKEKSEKTKEINKFDKDLKDEPEEPSETPMPLPEVGTVKGVLFIMLGSIINLISELLPAICGILSIVGIFLLIFGFFLIYQDRKRISKNHAKNLKLGMIILIIWIIINIIIVYYQFTVNQGLVERIDKFEDDEVLSKSIIIDVFNGLKIIAILSAFILGLGAILRFVTIEALIQRNFKMVLSLSVILLILGGFLSIYSSYDISDKIINNSGDITKDELAGGEFNNSSELNLNYYLVYGVQFLYVTAEAIMILCYYWTYTYQKTKTRKEYY